MRVQLLRRACGHRNRRYPRGDNCFFHSGSATFVREIDHAAGSPNFLGRAGIAGIGLRSGFAKAATPGPAAPGASLLPAGGGVNVRAFGTTGDGVTIDSAAIDRAIDSVAKRGGGTVYFPSRTYASYTIHQQSRVALYLDEGATLLAASVPKEGLSSGGYDRAEPQDPAVEPFQDFATTNGATA